MDVEVHTGVGNKDGVELLDEERVLVDPIADVGERYGSGRRASRSFSSYNRAYDTA